MLLALDVGNTNIVLAVFRRDGSEPPLIDHWRIRTDRDRTTDELGMLVKELIEREFDVEYHADHLSKLIRGLGLSAQKPMVRAKERDEKAIKRFVEVEFPAIEKKRGDAARR